MRAVAFVATVVAVSASGWKSRAAVPTVALKNAADPYMTMPAVGLGTGSYSDSAAPGYG